MAENNESNVDVRLSLEEQMIDYEMMGTENCATGLVK